MLEYGFELARMAIYLFQTQTFLAIGLVLSLCIGIPVFATSPWRD